MHAWRPLGENAVSKPILVNLIAARRQARQACVLMQDAFKRL